MIDKYMKKIAGREQFYWRMYLLDWVEAQLNLGVVIEEIPMTPHQYLTFLSQEQFFNGTKQPVNYFKGYKINIYSERVPNG